MMSPTPSPSPSSYSPDASPPDVTQLLVGWSGGDRSASEQLMAAVYAELHRQAARAMGRETPDHALQATALVNEAFVRLVDAREVDWTDRAHFFAVCAKVMRRILVDAARSRAAIKRGGQLDRAEHSTAINLDQLPSPASEISAQVCALDEALDRLAEIDPRRAQVIELRFFGGLTVEETAQVLQTSPQTVMREWKLARAWLARELSQASK